METITFYHYTDQSGKDAIVKDGKIHPSNGATDALFGPGVYGTRLPPSVGRQRIAWNNYDGVVRPGTLMRATWAIRVEVPRSSVKKVDSDRDIWIYTGGDLVLVPGHYEVIQVN